MTQDFGSACLNRKSTRFINQRFDEITFCWNCIHSQLDMAEEGLLLTRKISVASLSFIGAETSD